MPGHLIRQGRQRIEGTPAMVSRETWGFADAGAGNGKTDFEFVASTVSLSSDGRFETVAELDVEDGIGIELGRGMSENPLQAQAFFGTRLADDGVPTNVASGRYRIAVRTAQGRRKFNLAEGSLAQDDLYDQSDAKKDRRDRSPFPQTMPRFETEPEILTFDVNVDTDVTVAEPSTSSFSDMEAEGWLAESLE